VYLANLVLVNALAAPAALPQGAQALAAPAYAGPAYAVPALRAPTLRAPALTATALSASTLAADAPVAEAAPQSDEPLARDHCRGTIFHPSRQELGTFRLGVGALYDAIDPDAMFGFEFRFPHVSADARFGLGKGFSLTGHFDTVLVINELTAGAGWSQYFGPWSLEVGLEAGLFFGTLNEFGFSASYLAPMYVPRIVGGHSWKDIALSLSLDAMMTFTQVVTVGDVTEQVGDNVSFLGARATLTVENKMERGGIWYYGVAAMATKSYYQVWILLPDSPETLAYVRLLAGYEF
jgi:hypothetical protein